jgi:Rha family phage regulatory protein
MSQLILPNDYGVTEKKGVPVVSSRHVAEVFKREHKDVLEAIRNCSCSEEFSRRNFTPSTYKDSRGKKQPEILITKDGFAFIVMGFTGKKAAQFKEAYINRFNEMESFIKNLYEAKADFPEFTQAIMDAHEEPKNYHYSGELDMINRIVLGMDASHYKKAHNLGKVSSIRPYLTPAQIESIKTLQRIDIGLIVGIPDYQMRKQILTEQFARKSHLALASNG